MSQVVRATYASWALCATPRGKGITTARSRVAQDVLHSCRSMNRVHPASFVFLPLPPSRYLNGLGTRLGSTKRIGIVCPKRHILVIWNYYQSFHVVDRQPAVAMKIMISAATDTITIGPVVRLLAVVHERKALILTNLALILSIESCQAPGTWAIDPMVSMCSPPTLSMFAKSGMHVTCDFICNPAIAPLSLGFQLGSPKMFSGSTTANLAEET